MSARKILAFIALWVRNQLGRTKTSETFYGRLAEPAQFAVWLIQAGETDRLSTFHLRNLYAEYCDYVKADPVSERRLFRDLKAAGVQKYREGSGERRWVYRVTYPKLREVRTQDAA